MWIRRNADDSKLVHQWTAPLFRQISRYHRLTTICMGTWISAQESPVSARRSCPRVAELLRRADDEEKALHQIITQLNTSLARAEEVVAKLTSLAPDKAQAGGRRRRGFDFGWNCCATAATIFTGTRTSQVVAKKHIIPPSFHALRRWRGSKSC